MSEWLSPDIISIGVTLLVGQEAGVRRGGVAGHHAGQGCAGRQVFEALLWAGGGAEVSRDWDQGVLPAYSIVLIIGSQANQVSVRLLQ